MHTAWSPVGDDDPRRAVVRPRPGYRAPATVHNGYTCLAPTHSAAAAAARSTARLGHGRQDTHARTGAITGSRRPRGKGCRVAAVWRWLLLVVVSADCICCLVACACVRMCVLSMSSWMAVYHVPCTKKHTTTKP
jgi:hypothetical protein